MLQLHNWFEENSRDFPWRNRRSPYAVWISEIMLQQTRATVVIPYFLRWMELFPTITALKEAPIEKVIKAWEGLGYYSRARNIHIAAHQIIEEFNGDLPATEKELLKIKGIGPYTVGAILSFGFQKKAPAVDGNVIRVMSRLFQIEENIQKEKTKRKIRERTEELLDLKTPWITMEALIELGALVCQPNPKCDICPLKNRCLAFASKKQFALPIKTQERSITYLKRDVALLIYRNEVLIKREEKGKVMADLYEFPYFDADCFPMAKKIEKNFFLNIHWQKSFPSLQHTFTRFKVKLFPQLFSVSEKKEVSTYRWVKIEDLKKLPFSSGHRRLIQYLG